MLNLIKLLVFCLTISVCRGDFWAERNAFIKKEEARAIGGSIELDAKEKFANEILMERKLKEFDDGFRNPERFLPGMHTFEALKYIAKSEVFQFIQQLPKGGMLHGHDTALASHEFLFNLTYSDNLYACVVDGRLKLHFFKEPIYDTTCKWRPIQDMRSESDTFDDFVRSQLTLIRPDYREVYTDINAVWSHFMELFITVDPLICYKPVFLEYFYQVFQELYDDNVMYMEFRSTLPTVYDLDGNEYGPIEVAGLYKEALDKFMSTHSDFLGAKLIYAPVRKVSNATVSGYVDTALALKKAYPDFLAGFDLVGQEDLGYPLIDFINQLQELQGQLKFFFHAGETNWFGTSTDFNIVDAALLGTVRIGHGYALLKHPDVMDLVKAKGIGVEVCPVSNQVLLLVDDMRNHPANYLMANDFPVVICNDDPTFWGTQGSSYDWYFAFMGMASRNADLRFLKQLALNSLQYSAIEDKETAIARWKVKWNTFINNVIDQQISLNLHDPVVSILH